MGSGLRTLHGTNLNYVPCSDGPKEQCFAWSSFAQKPDQGKVYAYLALAHQGYFFKF